MRFRLIFTLPLTLLATFLHLGCCLLPLLSIAGTSFPYYDFFTRYKTMLTVFQLLVTMYLLGKIMLDQTHIKPFCDARERVIHWIGVVIAVVGLTISYYEPFKSEDQQLAEQQFLRFKSHRQMDISISGDYDHEKLLNDLAEIKGVKSNRIQISDGMVALTFQSNTTSRLEILENLRSKGYVVSD
jgi:uncharacterized membrane protein